MADFSGKTVMVTGATGNLGSAVVKAFAQAGASLALVDLKADRLQAAVEALTGVDCAPFAADLSSPDTVQTLVDDVAARFGKIDVLVHTVGGYAAGQPVHEAGLDVLEKMFDLNVKPLYLVGGTVARHMVTRGTPGRIIFVLAKAGLKGSKNHGAYTASKAAAFRIMESMAAELREHGIAVNGISPSTIDTPANRDAMPNANPDNWVTPQQLASGIVYLAGDDTGVYGTNLEVYGKGG